MNGIRMVQALIMEGQSNMALELLSQGADPSLEDRLGQNALTTTVIKDDLAAANAILEKAPNIKRTLLSGLPLSFIASKAMRRCHDTRKVNLQNNNPPGQ